MFKIGDRVKVGRIQHPYSRRFGIGEGIVVGIEGRYTLLVSFDDHGNPSIKPGWSNDIIGAKIELIKRKIDNVE